MFRINVILAVNDPADIDRVRELLSDAAALSKAEPGCVRFEVYHSTSDPQVFILNEWWESEAAWTAHRDERAFSEIYRPQVLPLVTRVPHICELLS